MLNERHYKENKVTDNIISDRLVNFDYKPLSRKNEKSLIKKSKLSFYNEVTDDLKKLYLNYYFEEFPEFKKKYENSLEKEKLIEQEIENSLVYRNYFIQNNARLVFSVIKNIKDINASFEDLFQEGMFGIVQALKKFDIESNNKFSTYAVYWIKQSAIKYYHNNGRIIRLPMRKSERFYSYQKLKNSLGVKFGAEPSNEEIARIMKIDTDELEDIIALANKLNPLYLDEPAGKDQSDTFGYFVSDDTCFEDEIDDKLLFSDLNDILEKINLKHIEREVLNKHYGLNGEETHKLSQIAKMYGLNYKRVRQIERQALSKLRCDHNIIKLHNGENQIINDYKVKKLK